MDLSKALTPDGVVLELEASSKTEVLDRLIHVLLHSKALEGHSEFTGPVVRDAVHARERERGTVLGRGVAIPHARLQGFRGVAMVVGILEKPVQFNDGDDEPVRIVFLFVTGKDHPPLALKLLGNIARLAMSPELLDRLLKEGTAEGVCALVRQHVLDFEAPLLAREVMRRPVAWLTPDTPLRSVINTMLAHNLDAMGIVHPDGTMAGEITCDRLFMLGMPDFFSQLRSVSFIREFDPFEKYFEKEANQTAGEVMLREFAAVNEDATIMEVIFLLAVKRNAKVYVLHEGKMVGIIDRIRVLSEILKV